MKERPLVFGPDSRLVGVLTEPAGGPDAQKTACIFINAGLVHHVGPNRLYVRLARHLASIGFPSLRFDLSNRGDSDVRRDGRDFLDGALVDMRAAMDVVSQLVRAERFVLIGICSGALNSLYAATQDERVAGAVAIDGPVYKTLGSRLRQITRRLGNRRTWMNTVTGKNTIGRLFVHRRIVASRPEDEFAHLYGDATLPSRDESSQALHTLVDRGVRLLFIYTGSWAIYNYENQFRDAFPGMMKGGAVHVVYAPDADHTFTRLHHQHRLLDIVSRWLATTFGTPSGSERAGQGEVTAAGSGAR
jgi:pimeloyl-ACP methyl ester carboxylesterase